MYLTRFLSLSSAGTFLIASQFPWFSDSPIEANLNSMALDEKTNPKTRGDTPVKDPQINLRTPQTPPLQPTVHTPPKPTPAPKANPNPNLNGYEPDNLIVRTDKKTPLKGGYLSKRVDRNTILLTLANDPEESVYISSNSFKDEKPRDFTLDFRGLKSKYDSIKKEEIQISLFSNPVWKSSDKKRDEYATKVKREEVLELFNLGLEENKVKQLLLSLTSKRVWIANQPYNSKPYYSTKNRGWDKAGDMEDLKNLEISYFTAFEKLKAYIAEKAKVCTNAERACIADISELDTYDYDEKEFHEEVLNLKR